MKEQILKVVVTGSKTTAINQSNVRVSIPRKIRAKAFAANKAISYFSDDKWSLIPLEHFDVTVTNTIDNQQKPSQTMDTNFYNLIHNSFQTKPEDIFISETKWKYLTRSILRGKNIMMTGPSGAGKTKIAKTIAQAMNRPLFVFNLGAMQDPRSSLIGNTHFSKENGTYFAQSEFIKAITTPNAVVVLDEVSRCHPDGWNILMTITDDHQRYVRVDEAPGSPVVNVAEGVSFIGTANIGNEFTATRVLDRALQDRFLNIEMDLLTQEEEAKLLKILYPELDHGSIRIISSIAHLTRTAVKSDSPEISTMISTRVNIEVAGLLMDGFSLVEAAEVAIYPFYPTDGGMASERTYVKQLVQKFVDDNTSNSLMV